MRFLGPFVIAFSLVLGASVARAQPASEITIKTFDPETSTEPLAGIEGPGIKVGEGTVLHPTFGAEAGVNSNVFFEDANSNTGGLLRLLAQIGVASLSNQRLTPASAEDAPTDVGFLQYRASLRASYDILLSGNDTVQDTGGLGIGGAGNLTVNPQGFLTLGVDENFQRIIRAANFETGVNTNRDINTFGAGLTLHSPKTTLSALAYYHNVIDVFERDEQHFANRIQHLIGVRPQWRFRAKTLLFVDVSEGFYSGLGDSTKVSSNPLTALAGIGTLFTPKLSLNFQAGYQNGFYSTGPSYSSLLLGAQVGYRYMPLGRATLMYDYHHDDSINANYYREHLIRLAVQHQFSPILVMVQPELHFRRYEGITVVAGPPARDDVIFSVIAGAFYNLRDSLAVTVDYRFSTVDTDYRYSAGAGVQDDPGYARHQLLAGIRWAL